MAYSEKKYDVVIAGAGPAGCACALSLKNSGLRVALIDKATFPRDKICGDALSADVINQLYEFFPDVYNKFIKIKDKRASYGVHFTSPNGYKMNIPFSGKYAGLAPGYISTRVVFDEFLLRTTINLVEDLDYFEDQTIQQVENNIDGVKIITSKSAFQANMVIAADGARSTIAKNLAYATFSRDQTCAGIRTYFKNVEGFDNQSYIELHFFKEVIPGYFWIFPMAENQANVGLGILSSVVSAKKLNLKKIAQDLIKDHPLIKDRFKSAEQIAEWKGHIIPLGVKKSHISGNRFLLTGDAAGLTDPLTGEGIGNALRSGRYAADHIKQCFQNNRFDEHFNLKYDQYLYKKIWRELKISHSLQRMLRFPFLFDFVVKKASNNESVKKIITSMLDNVDLKKELTQPSFYFRLLFK